MNSSSPPSFAPRSMLFQHRAFPDNRFQKRFDFAKYPKDKQSQGGAFRFMKGLGSQKRQIFVSIRGEKSTAFCLYNFFCFLPPLPDYHMRSTGQAGRYLPSQRVLQAPLGRVYLVAGLIKTARSLFGRAPPSDLFSHHLSILDRLRYVERMLDVSQSSNKDIYAVPHLLKRLVQASLRATGFIENALQSSCKRSANGRQSLKLLDPPSTISLLCIVFETGFSKTSNVLAMSLMGYVHSIREPVCKLTGRHRLQGGS